MVTTPFYQKALALFTRTQKAQIKKGLAKYPEPFNPHNWTPEELLNHALEETVDLTHYLVGLKELLDEKDHEIEGLKFENKKLTKRVSQLAGELWMKEEKPVRNLTKEKHELLDAKDKEIENLKTQLELTKRVNRISPEKSPFQRVYDLNFNPHFDQDDQHS